MSWPHGGTTNDARPTGPLFGVRLSARDGPSGGPARVPWPPPERQGGAWAMMPERPLSDYQTRPTREGQGEMLMNWVHTIGFGRLRDLEADAEFTPHTAVETSHLLEWAELVRYYQPDSPTAVQVGTVQTGYGPDIPLLAAGRPSDDRYVVLSPRMDGEVSDP